MATYGNGLNGSRDVYRTADLDSNLFLRAGQALVVPFIEVVSPDQTQSTIISETNTGALYIDNSASDGSIFVKPGADHDFVVQTSNSGTAETGILIDRTVPTTQSVQLNCDQNGALAIRSTQGIMRIYTSDNSGNGAYIETAVGNADSIEIGTMGVNGNILLAPGTTSGCVNITSDLINSGGGNSGLVVQARTTTGNGGILLANNNSTNQSFQMIVGGQTAGGISEDHFQCYAYAGGAGPKEIFDFTPDGSSVVLGEGDIVGGCNVGVNGTLGVGRVYDTAYNLPPTVAITGVGAGSSTTTLTNNTVQSFSFTPSVSGLHYINFAMSFGFSDASPAPSIPSGILQVWCQDTTSGPFSISRSQIAITNNMMATVPTSTAITTYLTSPFISNYFSGFFPLTAGSAYNVCYAWWSDSPLIFGSLGNTPAVVVSRIS